MFSAVEACQTGVQIVFTCTHSLPCRSVVEPGSWACPFLHKNKMARWFACGARRRLYRCRDRTAAHGCSQGEHDQRTFWVPCCILVGYMAQSGLMAECRLRRTLYEVSDTSHLCYTPWQRPGRGSLLLPQTLERKTHKWQVKRFSVFCAPWEIQITGNVE